LFDDDLIGEKSFAVTNGDLVKIAERDAEGRFPNFDRSLMQSPALPQGVQHNFPIDGDSNPEWLIDRGKGAYKVYFRVEPRIEVRPVLRPPQG